MQAVIGGSFANARAVYISIRDDDDERGARSLDFVTVVPAKAGIQFEHWIPAFAGMTMGRNRILRL
jgi:hypothetical protein